ncbi:MAG: FAD-dependent oxidoreductase [Candidatus Binataceae bacterium]
MTNRLGQHAIVIGGSIAGLITAGMLAEHFDHITVLERDHIDQQPALHKSIPQGAHFHTMLLGGQQVLSSLYPGFTDKLQSMGAVRVRIAEEIVFYPPGGGRAYSSTGSIKEPRDLGYSLHSQSRGLLEHCIRQFTLALPNVRLESDAAVQGLIYGDVRVQGVRYTSADGAGPLEADLVVDAGGRGSHAPRWLGELGFATPVETVIGVDFAYSTAKFRKPDHCDESAKIVALYGAPPDNASGALLAEIEDGLWQVSLAGRFGEYPPDDGEGFLAFAKSLYSTRLYDLIKDARRASEVSHYRFPTSVQRHYERLSAFPERFIVLGDAISSFNPVYGQGMSSAALQARSLGRLLSKRAAESRGLDGLVAEFFPQAAEVVSAPWTLSAGSDFAYPKTRGERPPDREAAVQYFTALDSIAGEDADVHRLLVEVFGLAKPLSALMEEPLRSRVLARFQARASA